MACAACHGSTVPQGANLEACTRCDRTHVREA